MNDWSYVVNILISKYLNFIILECSEYIMDINYGTDEVL